MRGRTVAGWLARRVGRDGSSHHAASDPLWGRGDGCVREGENA